jgi:hypothetical protein
MMSRLLFVVACVVVASPLAPAAEPDSVRRVIIRGEGAAALPEIGAILSVEQGALVVKMVAPAERRPEKYRSVDIVEGDVIMMVNGKRVKSAPEFTKAIDAVPPGEELKLGLQRGKQMMIAGFVRARPEELPQRQMIIRKEGEDNDSTQTFPALGVVLATTPAGVSVEHVLGLPESANGSTTHR